jgi:hypothetical protein
MPAAMVVRALGGEGEKAGEAVVRRPGSQGLGDVRQPEVVPVPFPPDAQDGFPFGNRRIKCL